MGVGARESLSCRTCVKEAKETVSDTTEMVTETWSSKFNIDKT